MEKTLGKFYIAEHSTKPPTFVQVIGWTKNATKPDVKRVHLYVRRVPLTIQHGPMGGSWEFDRQIIEQFSDISEPILKPNKDGTAIFIDLHHIRYNGHTLTLYN